MIQDLEKASPVDQGGYDVCVIGAGAAGIALALELSRQGQRVIILEAGGRTYETEAQDLYRGESVGLPYRGLYDRRYRVLGGTTSQWGGQILELDRHIFQHRPWVKGSGWPLSPEELAPYYRSALSFEGLEPDFTPPENKILQDAGASELLSLQYSRWCPIPNMAQVHRSRLESNAGPTVLLHANFTGFDLCGDVVRAARCRPLSGAEIYITARRFVLCAGGIETARLLLHPTTAGYEGPWMRSNFVGKHYQDHISCSGGEVIAANSKLLADAFDYSWRDGRKFHPKLKLPVASQELFSTLDVSGSVALGSAAQDDLSFAFETYRALMTRRLRSLSPSRLGHLLANLPQLASHRYPLLRHLRSFSTPRPTLRLFVHAEQAPLSSGYIALGGTKDRLGMQRAIVNWQISDQELHSIRTYLRVASETFARTGLGKLRLHPDVTWCDESLLARCEEASHHIGGARMASRSRNGVVDVNLRLFGTKNCYVCSSAVFPSAGYANPTHTIIALAYRLAGHLARLGGRAASVEPFRDVARRKRARQVAKRS